jgi:hypothetical protein
MYRPVHLLPIAAAVTIVLLGCAGIAAYLGWIAAPAQNSSARVSNPVQTAAAPRCGRCGVIEAVRDLGASSGVVSAASVTGAPLGQQLSGFSKDMTNLVGLLMIALTGTPTGRETGPATVREITVRFEDGSQRVLTEVGRAARRPGDRVKVVSGRIQPAPEIPEG